MARDDGVGLRGTAKGGAGVASVDDNFSAWMFVVSVHETRNNF